MNNRPAWAERLAALQGGWGRLGRDVLAVALLTLALLLLTGFLGWSQGVLLRWLVGWLRLWFGWGVFFLVALLFWLGAWTLRRDTGAFPVGRFVLAELALLAFALDVFGRIERLLLRASGNWGEEGQSLVLESAPEPQPVPEPDAKRPAVAPKKVDLPPEFRKSFKVKEQPDETVSEEDWVRSDALPPLNLLEDDRQVKPDERTINQTAGLIEKTLADFGIPAQVIGFRIGPTVTQFAVKPGFIEKGDGEDARRLKVRVAQIASLRRDLALALSAERLRIQAPVPGQSYVGIEVPNANASVVRMRSLLQSKAFVEMQSPLALALGRDVSGRPLVADLAKMPHLLIAGATGSGKSVCITAIAACLAMNNTPDQLKMVMIDAKMVELVRFNGLPHLLGKVETDVKRILGVLQWVVAEMEQRYKMLEMARARDISSYNRKMSRRKNGKPMPRMVVFIDELADLMMAAPEQTEHNLVRLAQMARATGIHLVVATQRPSTDVVTGLIKANFPARIAFAVASGIDSRVILDTPGAEHLLGRGDMLFLAPDASAPKRAQGVFVSDREIDRLIDYWQHNWQPQTAAAADDAAEPPWEEVLNAPEEDDDNEALIEEAIAIIRKTGRTSTSYLQRKLRIGYPRAARLLDELEARGIVGPAKSGGRERDILIDLDDDPEPED
jgi:S-DNA-T family DNA segregation ATPase FtsK/SpoIIIE